MQETGWSSLKVSAHAIRAAGIALLVIALSPGAGKGAEIVDPKAVSAIGTIDARFQSYNIEMVEVTGGRFWKPYAQGGGHHDRYAYRPPIDLANTRLRKLAAALGPAYLRVSGTWANATFLPTPTIRRPHRQPASTPCSAARNGAASLTLHVSPMQRS